MKQLHTVSLGLDGINEIDLPQKATVLGVVVNQTQEMPALVVESDTDEPNESRLFYVTVAGRIPFEAFGLEQRKYIGCAQAFPGMPIAKHVLEVERARGAK